MTDAPPSVEVDLEGMRRREAARKQLVAMKVDAKHVYRVWEAYESDRVLRLDGHFYQVAVIIYLTSKGLPRTALVHEDQMIVQEGWEGDHRIPRRKLTGER